MYNNGQGITIGNFRIRPFEGMPDSIWLATLEDGEESEGGQFNRVHFERKAAPLDKLAAEHAEKVAAYYKEYF